MGFCVSRQVGLANRLAEMLFTSYRMVKSKVLRSVIPSFLVCLWTSLVAQMVKASAYNVGDPGSISGSGRSPWRRKWQPTLVVLPGKSHGRTEEPGRLQSMGLQRVGHD